MSFLNITNTGSWEYTGNLPKNAVCLCKPTANIIYQHIKENSTLIDIGCGKGHYLDYIETINNKTVTLVGVEPIIKSDVTCYKNILNYDLTRQFYLTPGNVMCLEVLEHIPKEHEITAVENVVNCCNGLLFISWAKVGQPGDGHINCKNLDDVISLFKKYGFKLNEQITTELKSNATYWWLKNNLCCFER